MVLHFVPYYHYAPKRCRIFTNEKLSDNIRHVCINNLSSLFDICIPVSVRLKKALNGIIVVQELCWLLINPNRIYGNASLQAICAWTIMRHLILTASLFGLQHFPVEITR